MDYIGCEDMGNENNTQEANNIESEMRSRSGSYPMTNVSEQLRNFLQPILTKAFISQPILGNIIISDSERKLIHEISKSVLAGALDRVGTKNYGLDIFQCDILVLETVLLLRNWSDDENETDDSGDSDDNTNFWEYICNQYALIYDSYFGASHEYKIFRYAIKRSLLSHRRFFVKSGQKYYTTMLTHALAPKIRFNALFEQIFAFYAKSLDYHYIKNDPAFNAFAFAMNNRFITGKTQSGDSVYIKSVQSSSAIISLFKYCPNYMSDFVEHIIKGIDTLVSKGFINETSYIDTLLTQWHENRSREVRTSDRKKRLTASTDRVVTEFANIRPLYRYESERVSLVIPSIRLGAESDIEPFITIYRYQGDENPYSDRLRYFGDSICITSSKRSILLDDLFADSSANIEPRVVISFGGNDIYDSGTKLFREAIVFCDDGGEILRRPDKEHLNIYVTDTNVIAGLETSSDHSAVRCGNGYIYRVMIDENSHILINGLNLFPIVQVISGLTLDYSVPPVSYCTYIHEHHEYKIFLKQPVLTISSAEQKIDKRYRIIIDGDIRHIEAVGECDKNEMVVALPDSSGVHELRIIDNASHFCIFTINYVVFADFSLRFNGFYYCEGFDENGSVEISDNDGIKVYSYEKQLDQETMLLNYYDGDISLDIPTLRCRFEGEYQSVETDRLYWYKDINMSSSLVVEPPRGYSTAVAIGRRIFDINKVEIGNEINTINTDSLESVGVIIRKDAKLNYQLKLFDIIFEPTFLSPPLTASKTILNWYIEDNYIGDADCEFKFSIFYEGNLLYSYSVASKNEEITLEYPMDDGVYDYVIMMKSPGIFSEFNEIKKGTLFIGDPTMFWFDKRSVIVTEAIIDKESFALKKSSGIITNLEYIGVLPLNGESLPYPCYQGCLQYKYNGSLRPYSKHKSIRNGKRHEQVNPVKLWVINEYTISLRDPTDDGLYINRMWRSISDKEPDKNADVNDWYHPANYDTPDYYSYEIIMQTEVYDV